MTTDNKPENKTQDRNNQNRRNSRSRRNRDNDEFNFVENVIKTISLLGIVYQSIQILLRH